jgi:hypothetical protein
MVCITKEVNERIGDQIQLGLQLLHEDAKGKHLLNLFGIDELLPFDPSFLTTEKLLLQGKLNTLDTEIPHEQ